MPLKSLLRTRIKNRINRISLDADTQVLIINNL